MVRFELCDANDTSIESGAVALGLEELLVGDQPTKEDDDSDDDDTGFESSRDGRGLFGAFGGRFLWAITGLSLLSFKWQFAGGGGGITGAQDASELIGFFIHVATVMSSLLFFSAKSLLSRRPNP